MYEELTGLGIEDQASIRRRLPQDALTVAQAIAQEARWADWLVRLTTMTISPTAVLRGVTLSTPKSTPSAVHPCRQAMSERSKVARVATLETADGFWATVCVCTWPGGESEVRFLDFWVEADNYRRLEQLTGQPWSAYADVYSR